MRGFAGKHNYTPVFILNRRFIGDDVHPVSADDAFYNRRKREGVFYVINALFAVYNGEVSVGRKPFVGHNGDLFIMVDTAPTALFVAPENKFYFAVRLKTFVF